MALVTLGVVPRRVEDGFQSPRRRPLPTSQAVSRRAAKRVTSATAAVMILCGVDRNSCEPTGARTR